MPLSMEPTAQNEAIQHGGIIHVNIYTYKEFSVRETVKRCRAR